MIGSKRRKGAKSNRTAAKVRADAAGRQTTRAVLAHYDPRLDRIVVGLSSRIEVMFRPRDAQGLEHATPRQLRVIEISPSGLGIHFPRLDADIYLPALLKGFLGSKRWVASHVGKFGGRPKIKSAT